MVDASVSARSHIIIRQRKGPFLPFHSDECQHIEADQNKVLHYCNGKAHFYLLTVMGGAKLIKCCFYQQRITDGQGAGM